MQHLLSVWANLDMQRRIVVLGTTLLMFAAILGLSRVAMTPSQALLYSGLESGAAGDVVQSLEAQGVDYDIRGGAIFVPSNLRDQLRMTLAAEGLPANSTRGYELLDNLSGFGTTSQMFDAAYWRAKEGEIARTIISSPQIKSARVHIANPSSQPFRKQIAASAAVTVSANSGAISSDQAKAFRYLVASAVSGLDPEDVSVIDGRSGVVVTGDEGDAQLPANSDRAAELRKNVERLLEARVGAGKAVVEVSVETVTDQESIIERHIDPEGRVAISSETEELSNSATDSRGGSVTVASNLPNGEGAGGGDSSSSNSETRERVNYEVSETRREIQRGPGAIKRLTVAVLVDGIRTIDPETEELTWSARSDDEIENLRELVASAIGFDEARGDQITIKTMEFDAIEVAGTEVQSSLISGLTLDLMTLIQLLVLAVVTLVLGLFVLKPILSRPAAALPSPSAPALEPADTVGAPPATIPVPEFPLPAPSASTPALSGEIADEEFELPNLGVVSDFDLGDDELGLPTDPVKRLKAMIEERQDETVEILRSWMEEREENA